MQCSKCFGSGTDEGAACRRCFGKGTYAEEPVDGVAMVASVEPHPCRFFNGKCIDCGRSWGDRSTDGVEGKS